MADDSFECLIATANDPRIKDGHTVATITLLNILDALGAALKEAVDAAAMFPPRLNSHGKHKPAVEFRKATVDLENVCALARKASIAAEKME